MHALDVLYLSSAGQFYLGPVTCAQVLLNCMQRTFEVIICRGSTVQESLIFFKPRYRCSSSIALDATCNTLASAARLRLSKLI